MLEGEDRTEMVALNIRDRDNQENSDPAYQEATSSGPSMMMNPDGKGLWLRYLCVICGKILVTVLTITSTIYNIIQHVKLLNCQAALGPSDVSSCSQGWVKAGEMDYFFSTVEADWDASQGNCSSCGGSLLIIETMEEMELIKKIRGPAEYWLGLRRENMQQPWKRPNGSIFNNFYPIQSEGLCAYLNDQAVNSTWCTNTRYWICKKQK